MKLKPLTPTQKAYVDQFCGNVTHLLTSTEHGREYRLFWMPGMPRWVRHGTERWLVLDDDMMDNEEVISAVDLILYGAHRFPEEQDMRADTGGAIRP